MNKAISTKQRIFMCLVGPSGSGKTRLLYSMLTKSVFCPKYATILYFYKYYQPIFDDMQRDITGIEFIQGIDFDLIKNLPEDNTNRLLIFDDSSEEILKSTDFNNLATAGRHQKLHVIYIKHNLFHKSPLGRDAELQLTHIVLFKSPRDVQQISKLGQQLGKQSFITECYQDSVSRPFNFFMIDLTPLTPDCLRYCSGIDPTVFYLPNSKARITLIDDEFTTNLYSSAIQQTFTSGKGKILAKL